MTDDDVTARLRGIDGPRPLPAGLRSELDAQLTGLAAEVVSADAPRPLPDDLRGRLEASLLATAPLPRRLDQRLTAALVAPTPLILRVAAAVAAIVLVAGVLAAGTRDVADERLASPTTTPGLSEAGGRSTTTQPSSGASGAPSQGGAAAAAPPFVDTETAGAATGGSGAGGAPQADPTGTASSTPLRLVVTGDDTVAGAGFHAYLGILNRAGGVHGRLVETVPPAEAGGGAVASVNLGPAPEAGDGGSVPPWVQGVLFETLHVDDSRLRDVVTSLASPLEGQARLAVRRAFPEPSPGRRAAVYVDAAAPWVDRVAGAFDDALRARGVTPLRVPFDVNAPVLVDTDAAFLALPPASVAAWLAAASERSAPPIGTWGVASAWDDAFAADGAAVALHVLSPYAPATGDELAALRAALGQPISAEAVHGWVTAKAIAFLLFDNGGAGLTEASIDRLTGWSSSWSPPFETRLATRARTPEATHLVPDDDRFRSTGEFERDVS